MTEHASEYYNVGDVVELTKRGTVTARAQRGDYLLAVDGFIFGTTHFDIRVITPAPKKWKVGDVVQEGDPDVLPDGTMLSYIGGGSAPKLVKVRGEWTSLHSGHKGWWSTARRAILFLPEPS